MLLTVVSSKSLADVARIFPDVASRHGFGVLGVHDLRQRLEQKGVNFPKPCLVFEVCNPQKAKTVLERDMGLSALLPCRVSLYEEGGRTRLSTLLPTELIALFDHPELRTVAEEVEATLKKILADLS